MGYAPGTELRVDTAIRILIVKSANDVAVALAEAVAGSTGSFVARMNETARRLGMQDSMFANPNGLHDAGQYVTARDMAVLARRLLTDFPEYADLFAIPAIRSGDKVYYSYNLLLERFDGADGMKTGFVCASGYNMVASATRNGRQLIAVVFGAFSQTERAVTAARLLLDGFDRSGGLSLAEYRPIAGSNPATSQRGRMCSEEARKSRYDPGAGDARIDSPFLSERRITRDPVPVSTGGVDAPPSEALRYAAYIPKSTVPVPTLRPRFVRRDIDGVEISGYAPPPGTIPVPEPRPNRSAAN
jgi:D-alanyl-D-alanine carboxypeptidase